MCNTIDLNRFKPVEMQKEYDLIFIGRLEKGKNIKFLLDVVSDTNYKTLIVGKGSLDYLVKDAVQQYHNIEWRERVDNAELPLYYNKSRCFILLSHLEGNPKVLLEAMACGLPVIGTKVPGTRECIVQGSNGFLVNMDVNEVKSRISELLSSPDQMSAVGAHARAWVANHSDMDKNITTEAEFYFNYLREPNVLYS